MINAIITQSVTNGDTTHAPSGDAVYDSINANTNYIVRDNESGIDLNNLVSSGSYNCDNCTNSPYTYAKVFVESDSSNSWVKQTAINVLTQQVAWRIKNVSTWSDWKSFSPILEEGSGITSGYTIEDGYLYKYDKLVIFMVYLNVQSEIAARASIANVPLAYRPARNIQCPAHLFESGQRNGVNNFFIVDTNGNLSQAYETSMQIGRVCVVGSWITN